MLSENAAKELETLKTKLNLGSISDVIRGSIALQKFLEEKKEAGNDIILRNKKTDKEQILVTMR